mgnify:FL=1
MLLAESQWFQPNIMEVNRSYKEIYNDYKFWLEQSKRQGYHSRTYFAFENMKAKINEILENTINIPEQVKLSLPKLKKINGGEKLSPKLKLPKLKKL